MMSGNKLINTILSRIDFWLVPILIIVSFILGTLALVVMGCEITTQATFWGFFFYMNGVITMIVYAKTIKRLKEVETKFDSFYISTPNEFNSSGINTKVTVDASFQQTQHPETESFVTLQ